MPPADPAPAGPAATDPAAADPADLGSRPDRAARLCRDAHDRLQRGVAGLTDEVARRPSRLPGWTVGHVITHLARNADGHARRLGGALRGEDIPRYPGGRAQRAADIDRGAARPAAELLADLETSRSALEAVFSDCAAAGWPNGHLRADDDYGAAACPARRLREVEMHHVDLGLGYEPADWPDEYVDWDLPLLLATVPGRLHAPDQRRAVTAWLAGRGPAPSGLDLAAW